MHWTPPALKLVAKEGTGITELIEALDRHFMYLETSGTLRNRRRQRLRDRVRDAVDFRVRDRVWGNTTIAQTVETELESLEAGRVSPLAVADAILSNSADLFGKPTGVGS
jgi:LAO/AO transport system kinase